MPGWPIRPPKLKMRMKTLGKSGHSAAIRHHGWQQKTASCYRRRHQWIGRCLLCQTPCRAAGISLDVVLVEARHRIGGLIRSERVQGCLVEHGPDAVLRKKPAAEELCKTLGLTQIMRAPAANQGFYVLHRGRITPLPDGYRMVAPTKKMPLFTSRLFSTSVRFAFAWNPWFPSASWIRKRVWAPSFGDGLDGKPWSE